MSEETTEHGVITQSVLDRKDVSLPHWVSVNYPWCYRFSDLHGKGFGGYGFLRFNISYVFSDMSVEYAICPLCTYSFYIYIYIYTHKDWNFNVGNAAVTFDTAHLQSSYFHRPSMYSPKLRRTRSQR